MKAGEEYTAQYAEGISNPGDVTPKHRHPGPEAWYTVAGEFCAEAADGTVRDMLLVLAKVSSFRLTLLAGL